MTINNSETNGHEMEMYEHDFSMNIKNQNQMVLKNVSINWHQCSELPVFWPIYCLKGEKIMAIIFPLKQQIS